jgi:orotate phosphoribosyltransferase
MNNTHLPFADLACALLLDAGAVKVSVDKPFKLTSGKFSPVYFDCRRLISVPPAMTLIAGMFQWILERSAISVDVVAGGESAGIPFADRLACLLGKPMVYVRKQAREQGTGSAVEGQIATGARVVLVEDMITDGGSKMAFVQGLRDAGAVVDHCLVVLDREQGGASALSKENVCLHPLTTAAATLRYGLCAKLIMQDAYDAAMAHLKSPELWRPPDGH